MARETGEAGEQLVTERRGATASWGVVTSMDDLQVAVQVLQSFHDLHTCGEEDK